MKREFLMLAHVFDPKKHCIAGWYMSEKLDGMRAYWDGGISRGILKSEIPWANNDKDERYKTPPIATGLWSRYGNVIHAPDWWLDSMPTTPLDGELYSYDMPRQDLMSEVKKLSPGNWFGVQLLAFGVPNYERVFADGYIDNTNFKKRFDGIVTWLQMHGGTHSVNWPNVTNFECEYNTLRKLIPSKVWRPHAQMRLPMYTLDAEKQVNNYLEAITDRGGEGLMLRKPESVWMPERSHYLLKVKKLSDTEGTIVGYITGRDGKLIGMMGAMVLKLDSGQTLELSGFTDQERTFASDAMKAWAIVNPGSWCPEWMELSSFKRGDRVTLRYRGLSKDGIPQEARYWRKYDGNR